MLSQNATNLVFTIISILFVLWGLEICAWIWWVLASGQVEEYRTAMVRRWCCEEEVVTGEGSGSEK
jgi:hypothetical protein